jgi:anti-sigma regulatory factor (Ser/Thr protein kinase)
LPSLLTICQFPCIDYRPRVPNVQAATMQAQKGHAVMARTTAEPNPRLIAFSLPSTPASVPIARFHVRAALALHGLDDYADDAAAITSELVTNAVQHVRRSGAATIEVTLARARDPAAVTVTVTDSSPEGPTRRDTPPDSERGRGLQVVEALSARWGWNRHDRGKVIFAVLAREA